MAVLLMDNAIVNLNTAVNASKRLQSLGIRVVAIDVTGSVGVATLRSLTAKPGDVIVAAGYTFLATKNDQLGTIICSDNPRQYIIGYFTLTEIFILVAVGMLFSTVTKLLTAFCSLIYLRA